MASLPRVMRVMRDQGFDKVKDEDGDEDGDGDGDVVAQAIISASWRSAWVRASGSEGDEESESESSMWIPRMRVRLWVKAAAAMWGRAEQSVAGRRIVGKPFWAMEAMSAVTRGGDLQVRSLL